MKAGLDDSVPGNALGVDRRVDRGATKFQWNQCYRATCRAVCEGSGVGACLS
jgi:hypothetical protein